MQYAMCYSTAVLYSCYAPGIVTQFYALCTFRQIIFIPPPPPHLNRKNKEAGLIVASFDRGQPETEEDGRRREAGTQV